MQQLNEPDALRMSHPAVDLARTQSLNNYKKLKKDDKALRQAFRREINTRRAEKYKTSVEAKEKVTKNALKSKGAWKRINRVLSKKERNAVTSVKSTDEFDITKESTETLTLSTTHAAKKALIATDNVPTPLSCNRHYRPISAISGNKLPSTKSSMALISVPQVHPSMSSSSYMNYAGPQHRYPQQSQAKPPLRNTSKDGDA
jgi:hypothetical protein